MEPTLDQFDLLLSDADGNETIGLRVDWSATDEAPVILVQEEVRPEGGELATEGDELYSSRDLGDSYRIMYRNFSSGGGQITRDVKDYDPARFYVSRSIDNALDGIRLAPGSGMSTMAGLRGDVIEYRGRLACSADMGTNTNDRQQVKFFDPAETDPLDAWTAASGITADYEATALATDGEYCYVALAQSAGIWRGYDPRDSASSWQQYSTTANVTHLEYCTGYLYGVQNDSVGYFDSGAVFQPISLLGALTPDRDTFGLTAIGSWIYWGVRKGARSWVYALQHNPGDPNNPNPFEQYVELPTGFVATCMDGYLGSLFIGGYYPSNRSDGVAQGAVYLATENGIALLCLVGDDPSHYDSDAPLPSGNFWDNKISGVQGYGHDLWIVTDGDLYRWNIKEGGLIHVREVYGYLDDDSLADYQPDWDGWTGSRWIAWEPTDDPNEVARYSPEVRENTWHQYPGSDYGPGSGMDQDTIGGVTMVCARHRIAAKDATPYAASGLSWPSIGDYTYRSWSDADLKYDNGKVVNPHRQCVLYRYPQEHFPSGNTFDNADGVTMELDVLRVFGRALEFGVVDGVREAVVRVRGSWEADEDWWVVQVGEWNATKAEYVWWQSGRQSGRKKLHTLRLALRDTTAELYVDGNLIHKTTKTKEATGGTEFGPHLWWSAGWSKHPADPDADGWTKPWVLDIYGVKFTIGGIYAPAIIPGGYAANSFAVLNGTPYLAVDNTFSGVATQGLTWLDWSKYVTRGELVTSWSSGRMPGVKKYFAWIDVVHSRLSDGEQVVLQLELDEAPEDGGGAVTIVLDPLEVTGTLTQVPLEVSGSRVRVKTLLLGTGETTPTVYSMVVRYGSEPKSYQQYYLDLRQNVKTLTGEDFDWASTNVTLQRIVNEGKPVTLRDLSGSRRVVPEILQFKQAMPSRDHDRFVPQGKAILRLRTVR